MSRFTGITGARKSTSELASNGKPLESINKYSARECFEKLGVSSDRKKDMKDQILAHFLKSSDLESQKLEIRRLRKKQEVVEAYAIEFEERELAKYTTCSGSDLNSSQRREMLVRLIDIWFTNKNTNQARKSRIQTEDQPASSGDPQRQETDVTRIDRASCAELNRPKLDLVASAEKPRSVPDSSLGFQIPDDAFELDFEPTATDTQRVKAVPYRKSHGNYLFVSSATSPTSPASPASLASEVPQTPEPTRAEALNVNHDQQRSEFPIVEPDHSTSSSRGKRPVRPWENWESQAKQCFTPTLSRPKQSPVSVLSRKRGWEVEVNEEPQSSANATSRPTTKRMRIGNDLLSIENSREAATSPVATVAPQHVTSKEPSRNNDQTLNSPRRPASESTVVPVEPTDQQMSNDQACIEGAGNERQKYRLEAMQDLMNRYKKWQCETYVDDVKMQKTRLDRLLYEARYATLDRVVSDIQCIIKEEIWNEGQQTLAAARSRQTLPSPADDLAR